ncbi:IQ-domain 28 [Arabidopsis thaliana]|uniref:IQ-domain 28 n=1 Tax=Arabidopsis thaliana TaxID=3702 RepID=F4HUK0_ARATH|nr:IQ-domain 28 [Arabidopsis thaliana]NP_001323291.1 IQ-domain 28 [Arabidopsis thaliana]NP_973824.1 IQ-domain 28 [Arabidopsis thaliana]AEE29155.1 IQ-domain 28 [Arabidopsis thaliana]ANM61045.1 IQ-domain 28 [Arabidopsis thaliana]ANM61048.1 IQ-domain 28 [Arabidopsis thaliana]|eukprot:NP_001319001.1 IQ-domain 28 [Arabidopsis thaliana]
MGKTPGKWIKTLLLGKKSPKSNSDNRSQKLKSAKKEELVESVTEDLSNLTVDPPVVSSQPVPASTAQNVVSPINGDESKDNLESRNDLGEVELEQAAIKVQATFRAHQARRAFRTLKGIIRLQAVIRGHLVRRQAIATYSCIWGIVKFQALVRGQKARSSDIAIQFQKKHMEASDSEVLQSSTCSWMDNPTKFVFVDKLLASSPTALPLKIQYGPEEPNSAKVWLERWTQLQVWSSGSRVPRIEIPKSQSKKRNYQAVVEAEKKRPKRSIKKPSGTTSGTGPSRFTAERNKPKRNVRKASTLSKDPLRNESDKANHNSRKSRSGSKEGSPLEIKDEKPSPSLKRSSLSNGSKKATLRSAEKKKKDIPDSSVQIQPEGKVSENVLEEGDNIESSGKEKDTGDSVQIESEGKVLEGGDNIEFGEKEKDKADAVPIEFDIVKDEKSPVLDRTEEDELKTAETSDKAEALKCADVKVSSENGNVGSDNTKQSEKRALLPANIDKQDDGLTLSGRKIPSYMAPTASAKARVKGEASPRFAQAKTEINGALRRHSLPSPANGKLSTTTMSPRAQKLLLASAKGSMNGDKSFTSSKDITHKSTRTDWKR